MSCKVLRKQITSMVVFCLLLGWLPAIVEAVPLTREEAANALLDPGSGVPIDPCTSVWSPFVDFGSGAGFEGLLPAGSQVDPATLGQLPFPGPGMEVNVDSYFFWLDDFLGGQFQHPVRFVLLDASNASPTVGNGGILVANQGWWPVITRPGLLVDEFFHTLFDVASDNPPGFDNPEGLISGAAISPGDIEILPPPAGFAAFDADTANNACALLLSGDSRADFRNDVTRWASDLTGHYGVDPCRIVTANSGNAASKQDLGDAIDAICAKQPPCDKIYVRMSSHGSVGSYSLADGSISKQELCQKFQKLAAKGVPICLIINGCHTSSLKDANHWNFPAGSSIITTAASDRSSYGGTYKDGTTTFTGSVFPYAHTKCLNDTTDSDSDGKVDADTDKDGTVDDCEAFDWVIEKKPCYRWTGNNTNTYPAGPPTGATSTKPTQNAEKASVGRDPERININVQNATGATKTDFHLVFKGDVRGGMARAWRSDPCDHLGAGWAEGLRETTIGYDEEKDETMVCWIDQDNPVLNGQYIHFGYSSPQGGLRPARQYWTPTAEPPEQQDRVPTQETSIHVIPEEDTVVIRLANRGPDSDGFPGVILGDASLRVVQVPIQLVELNLVSIEPVTVNLIPLGPFSLPPDTAIEFAVPIEGVFGPGDRPVIETHTAWGENPNTASRLELFDPVIPHPDCWSCQSQAVGDANNDGKVNFNDWAIWAGAAGKFGSNMGDSRYNPCADFSRNGRVCREDFEILLTNWTDTGFLTCPDSSTQDCCSASPDGTPGCVDPIVEECVCELDPFCCDVQWDAVCAQLVEERGCGLCAGPSEGDCCQDHAAPGCVDPVVRDCVCAVDSYCCDFDWDETCVTEVADLGCGSCASGESCCEAHAGPGCNDPAIEACVCGSDPFCCNNQWDQTCVDEVTGFACGDCGGTGDDCCVTHPTGGCTNPGVEACVCDVDPSCCGTEWSQLCVDLATSDCDWCSTPF